MYFSDEVEPVQGNYGAQSLTSLLKGHSIENFDQ